jgi:hypothetical protein
MVAWTAQLFCICEVLCSNCRYRLAIPMEIIIATVSVSRKNAGVLLQFRPQTLNSTSFQIHCPLSIQSLALCNLTYFHCYGYSSLLQTKGTILWHIPHQKLPTALTATAVQCKACLWKLFIWTTHYTFSPSLNFNYIFKHIPMFSLTTRSSKPMLIQENT